jgi:hypothetical protein
VGELQPVRRRWHTLSNCPTCPVTSQGHSPTSDLEWKADLQISSSASAFDPACVKIRTGLISTNYLYNINLIRLEISGLLSLSRHEIAPTSDTSAFLHNQDPERTLLPGLLGLRATSCCCWGPNLRQTAACLRKRRLGYLSTYGRDEDRKVIITEVSRSPNQS